MKVTGLFFVITVACLTNGPADACDYFNAIDSTESQSSGTHETNTKHEEKLESPSPSETEEAKQPLLPKPIRKQQQQQQNETPKKTHTPEKEHTTPPTNHQEKEEKHSEQQKEKNESPKETSKSTPEPDDIPESHREAITLKSKLTLVVPALSQPEKDDIVTTLNDARAKARGTAINKLAWDHKLEEGAEGIAKECKHMSNEENKPIVILQHHKNKERGPTVGLTFYIGSKEKKMHRPIVSVALAAFMTGKQHIKSGDCKGLEEAKAKDCTHYKQVVSANTTHVGCAMVKCPSANAWFGGALNNEDKTPSFRLLCEFVPPYSEEGPAYIPVKRGQNPGDDCQEPRKADGHGLCVEEPKSDTHADADPDADIRLKGDERTRILTVLNHYRKDVGATAMNKLYWSNKLEKHVIGTARDCKQLAPIQYYKGISSTGISYIIPTSARPTIDKAFDYVSTGKSLYEEHGGECQWDQRAEKDQQDCLFYKQIVWAATTLVGCVMTECKTVPKTGWFYSNAGSTDSDQEVFFRMFCLYHSPYDVKGAAYIKAPNNGVPGSDCEDLYHRKNDNGLCVDFALEEEPEMDLDHDATAALTEKEQENILDMLNEVRQELKAAAMNKLYWNKQLAAHAENFGTQCEEQQMAVVNKRHEDDVKGDSESISYRVAGLQRPSIRTALYYIHTGKTYYEKAKGNCEKSQKSGCLHYKQVVTADTREIGCAMVKCPQPKSFVGGTAEWLVGLNDEPPSYRMICEYRPAFDEDSIAYAKARNEVGEGCLTIYGLIHNGHGLCVIELIETEKTDVEKILNKARADAKSNATNVLTWSKELEKTAMQFGSQCTSRTHLAIVRTKLNVGVVTYRTKETVRPFVELALDYAINGKKQYKAAVEKGDCRRQGEGCLPYKQAVTAATTKVGCAMVKCEEVLSTILSSITHTFHMVCAYQPAYEDWKPAYVPAENDDEVGTGCEQYGKKPNRQGLCDEELKRKKSLDD